jgi:hypothetical protein
MKNSKIRTKLTLENIRKTTQMGLKNQFDHTGKMPTALICFSDSQTVNVLPCLTDDEAKDKFAELVTLLCTAVAAKAIAFVAESWTCKDFQARPSEHPDRQEVVMLSIEMRGHPAEVWMYPIIRSGTEKPKLGQPTFISSAESGGRFTHLLPANPPTDGERIIASHVLERRGYKTENDRARWN